MPPKPQNKRMPDKNNLSVEQLSRRVEAGRVEFVMTELDVAITFCEVALSTSDPAKKERNIENALKGYETALRFSPKPQQSLKNDRQFQRRLGDLKGRLHQLGREV